MATTVERAGLAAWPGRAPARRIDYRRQWAVLIAGLVVVDALAVFASLSLAYLVRVSSGLVPYFGTFQLQTYHSFLVLSIPMWLVIFAALGLYRPDRLLGGLGEYTVALQGCLGGVTGIIVLSFLAGEKVFLSRGWLLVAGGLSVFFVLLGRFGMRRLGYALQRRGYLTPRVLIVGANDQGIAMAHQWLYAQPSGMAVVGFLDDFKALGTQVVDGLAVLGRPSALETIAREVDAQEVVVVSGAVAWESFQEILDRPLQRNGYTVRLSPGFYGKLGTGVMVSNKSFVPLLTVREDRLTGLEFVIKGVLDYTITILYAIPAFVVMAAIAVGLRLVAPGEPLFDRYLMWGLRKAPFAMWKFHARPGGSRLEDALLASGLDKTPQVFNLLCGHMSLVGPRPRVAESAAAECGDARNLFTVKPGVIGPWTIDAVWLSGDEQQDELYYIRNWTVWLDLQVIFQTFLRWVRLGRGRRMKAEG